MTGPRASMSLPSLNWAESADQLKKVVFENQWDFAIP